MTFKPLEGMLKQLQHAQRALRRERPCCRRAAEQRDELAAFSLDHLVGEREQLVRHVEAERLGGL